MRKNKKKTRVMLLLILLLVITIGYSLLSTTLKINGTTNIAKQAWSIYWDNAVVNQNSVNPSNEPQIGEDLGDASNTKVTWTVTLNLPGDYYEFTVDAVNEGSVDAMITDTITTITDGSDQTTTLQPYIKYTVTYLDGTIPSKYQILKKATVSGNTTTPTVETYKVKVEFLDTITQAQMDAIPVGGLTYKFSYQVTYGQADVLAYDRTYSDLEFTDTTYGYSPETVYIGNTLASGTTTSDYTTLTTGVDKGVFLGFKLDSNRKILKAYACGIYDSKLFCIEGPGSANTFAIAHELLPTIYGVYDSSTDIGCREATTTAYVCYNGDPNNPVVYVSTNSNVYIKSGSTIINQAQVFPGGPNNTGGSTLNYPNS